MNPDDTQIEIPLQNERFLEQQADGTLKPSLRLLKIFVDEQAMMGFPTVGHISPEQYEQFKDTQEVQTMTVQEDDNPDSLYIAVTKNPRFELKVVGRADHPGTDYYEEPKNEGEDGEVYVPPVFNPKTGLPQDMPSVIKAAEPENKNDEETQDAEVSKD